MNQQKVNVTMNVAVSGEYFIEVLNEKDEVVATHKQKNVITDRFLAAMASASTSTQVNYGYMSTSTTDPVASATTMPSTVASTSNKSWTISTSGSGLDWYTNSRYTFTFATNQYIGTITAVGVGNGNAGAGLTSWVKLKDGDGLDTTLTLITGDRLRITYTLRMKRPNTQTSGTINMAGIDYNYVLSPMNIASSSAEWQQLADVFSINTISTSMRIYPFKNAGTITGASTGTGLVQGGDPTSYSYAPSGNTVNWTITANEGTWNYSIGCMMNGNYFMNFTPALPKNSTQILTLTFQTVFTAA